MKLLAELGAAIWALAWVAMYIRAVLAPRCSEEGEGSDYFDEGGSFGASLDVSKKLPGAEPPSIGAVSRETAACDTATPEFATRERVPQSR